MLLGIKLTSDMHLKEHGDYIFKRLACGMAVLRNLSDLVLRVLFFGELMKHLFLATYHIVGLGYVIRLSQL